MKNAIIFTRVFAPGKNRLGKAFPGGPLRTMVQWIFCQGINSASRLYRDAWLNEVET